jgi:prepilin-type N-terminal cleavage/methylation domain-containing protein
MKKIFIKKNTGFTLLETLIAIAILTIALGAAFSVAQKSLSASYTAKNQTTAFFLASEGLELVRNIRDNVALYNATNNKSLDWLQPFKARCGITDYTQLLSDSCIFDIDPFSSASDLYTNDGGTLNLPTALRRAGQQADCDTALGCRLKINAIPSGTGKYYAATDVSAASIYYRKISIKEVNVSGGTGKREAIVTVTVRWLGSQQFTISETLSNWH